MVAKDYTLQTNNNIANSSQTIDEHLPLNLKSFYYIECVSIIGTKLYFNLYLVPTFLKQLDFWLILFSFVALMTILDPTNVVDIIGYIDAAFIWLVFSVLYLAMSISIITGLSQQRYQIHHRNCLDF